MADIKNTTEETIVDSASTSKVKAAPVKKVAKKYAPDDRIACRSVTAGELILIGRKTKLQYIWSDYGDVTYVEYQDLLALHSLRSSFLTKPLFIIEDEELVAEWTQLLGKLYDSIQDHDLDKLFSLKPDRFKTALAKLPAGMRESLKTKAVNMIKAEELNDIRLVRAIDEVLGTEIKEMFLS